MKKEYSEHYISELIERFMTGDTTLEEEKVLGEYFRMARHIPAEWEIYRQMFGYFDRGMTNRKPALRGWLSSVGTVAAILIAVFVLSIGLYHRGSGTVESGDELSGVVAVACGNNSHEQKHSSGDTIMPVDRLIIHDKNAVGKSVVSDEKAAVTVKVYKRRTSLLKAEDGVGHAVQSNDTESDAEMSYAEMEENMRKYYNDMVEAECDERIKYGDCCMLVEDIDGYYEIVECHDDIELL